MKKIILLIIFLTTVLWGQSIRIIIMGVVPGKAPEFEKEFEKLLRQEIVVIPKVSVADYNDTEYLKRKSDFFDAPVVSRRLVNTLRSISHDRLLVVWGEIEDFTIKPVRHLLLGAKAVGSLRFTLTMYSLSLKEYSYLGEFESKTNIPKPPVFFRNVEKVTHISASDRTTLINELSRIAVAKSVDIMTGVVQNLLVSEGISESSSPEGVKLKKAPSVSDLFDIPSVEAPDVTKGKIKRNKDKKDTKKPEKKPVKGKEKREKDK